MIERIKQLASDYLDEIITIRRTIHANPELAFEERQTAELISKHLTEYGIEHKIGVAKTGIVALIEGKKPNKKVVALRADMDALPILEQNEVSYKSTKKGLMHACGHDAHTASLLGTAKILSRLKNEFEGTVKLIFQPSEEKLPGGASIMIKEGVLENPDVELIFGQHVYPALEAGKVGFRSGPYMASADEIYLSIIGQGGHAALPGTYNNPLYVASKVLVELEILAIKLLQEKVVLAFGKIEGKGATNVIPEKVEIQGTLRTLDNEQRLQIHGQIRNLVTEICEKNKAAAEVDIRIGYPPLVNNEAITEQAKANAIDYLGGSNVIDLDIRMTAEDFAFYSQKAKSCFYRFGVANHQKGINSSVHTSTFDIDEQSLQTSSGLMAYIALTALNDRITHK